MVGDVDDECKSIHFFSLTTNTTTILDLDLDFEFVTQLVVGDVDDGKLGDGCKSINFFFSTTTTTTTTTLDLDLDLGYPSWSKKEVDDMRLFIVFFVSF